MTEEEGTSPVADSSYLEVRLNIRRSAARWAAGREVETELVSGPFNPGGKEQRQLVML